MSKGKVIVVEGACDGIGKTTQFELLKEHLVKDGKKIYSHHFPTYGSVQGKPVEEYLAGKYGKPSELSPYFINDLYAIDRAVTWHTELKEKYNDGEIIVLDRYTSSTLIYQAALIEDIDERIAFFDYVCNHEYNKLGIKKPDHVIFLHAPFDLVTEIRNARKENDGISNDVHESDLDYMRKVYENAMFVADYLSWDRIKCDEDGKMRSIEDIHNDVYKYVKKKGLDG